MDKITKYDYYTNVRIEGEYIQFHKALVENSSLKFRIGFLESENRRLKKKLKKHKID